MSEYEEKLGNKKFEYWLKSILATAITKEGLDETVMEEIDKVHKDIVKKVSKNMLCSNCSIEQLIHCNTVGFCTFKHQQCSVHKQKKIRKCPNGICDKFKEEIKKRHKYNKPSWRLTKAENWCSSPFEVAKCYLPPAGYDKSTNIEHIDLNGVLSIILNLKDILVQYDEATCEEAREVTRLVRHSPYLLIEENEMNKKLDVLMKLLGYSQHPRAVEAQQKINQLKTDQLSITTDYIAKVLQDVISENTEESTKRILEETRNAISEVHDKKAESIHEILDVVKKIKTSLEYDMKQKYYNTISGSRKSYEEIKLCLREDLLTLNMDHHGTITVPPLFYQSDTPLQEVYVIPDTHFGEFPQKVFCDSSQEPVHLLSLDKVFKRNGKKCRDIYVTSEAGLGKTVFCKRLALIWCKAHQSDQSEIMSDVTPEEKSIMKGFEFLFLISLRDVSPKDCEVDAMIQHQIIGYMSRPRLYPKEFLEDLFHSESCLIIIDGLDEWTHPKTDILTCYKRKDCAPHRQSRKNCTFITTSRPWKFHEIKLRTSHIDQHLEITGLSKGASDELTKRAIQKLHQKQLNEEQVLDEVGAFNSLIDSRNIHELKSDPLVLMYLTCLWCDDRNNFGHSRCDIYSSLVDLLLERAESRNSHIQLLHTNNGDIELPQCFRLHKHSRRYSKSLISLGKLAFQTFFTNAREHSLVFAFSSVELENILTPGEAMLVKEAGFLTASKYFSRDVARYSFYHKTMQEFFVALYLQHSQEFTPVLDLMDNVERIISNTKTLVFLSGLNPGVASNLSKELCQKISGFQDVQGYRSDMGSFNYFIGYNKTMKAYQNLHIACYREYHDTFRFGTQQQSLFLYQNDVFIDEDFHKDDYALSLKTIIDVNGPNIRSVKIRDVRTEAEFQESIRMLKQKQISHLEKLDLKCQIDEASLCDLLETSKHTLSYFVIKGGEWQNDGWTHRRVAFSCRLFRSIQNLQNISELYLRTLKLSHEQLNEVVSFISNRVNMKQIGLNFITCSNHAVRCSGVMLNLARHTNLKMLELGDIPLSDVSIYTNKLEVCYIGTFPKREIMVKIFNLLRSAPSLHVLVCGFLETTHDIKEMLCTLVELPTVQYIWLISVDLGNHVLPEKAKWENLQALLMIKVKMTTDTFRNIVKLASDVKNAVRIGLFESIVEEKEDFERLKQDLEFLQECELLLNDYSDIDRNEVLIRTVKVRRISQ